MVVAVMGFMLFWSFVVSVGARNYIVWRQREFRNPDSLLAMLRDNAGAGSHKAYLFPWELYYAARALGWESYKCTGREDPADPRFAALLRNMDVVVRGAGKTDKHLDDLMSSMGFVSQRAWASHPPANSRETYGEYVFYMRPLPRPDLHP